MICMRLSNLLYLILILQFKSFAAVPVNDNIGSATLLSNTNAYCSEDTYFSNLEATASGYKKATNWLSEGKDIWFKFIATHTDVSVSIAGQSAQNTNTITNPLAAFYIYENNVLTEQIGSMSTNNNLTIAYKGGLSIGKTYYLRVSAENDATGSFKMCINNYNPPKKPGQDCSTAAILCSKETFTELNISGAGNDNRESIGTCLSTESNSAWYIFTAANNGTLTFTITPTNNADDIDWVLYDLGINGNCNNISAANALRCAAGSGVNCLPKYFVTGLSMDATDINERSGCVNGQDGMLKFVEAEIGHTYALLIDNFSSGNNGFTISFGGSIEFEGPNAQINMVKNNACTVSQDFTFSTQAKNYTALKWNFGEGATIENANTIGPHTIKYNTPGIKTIILETTGTKGCVNISTYTLEIAQMPLAPIVTSNKTNFCIGEIAILSVKEIPGISYLWSGPANFSAATPTIYIPITAAVPSQSYKVRAINGDCLSEQSEILLPAIAPAPKASFATDPPLPAKLAAPSTIRFINQSTDAETFLWDFGNGETAITKNPSYTFKEGSYQIKLTAYGKNGCLSATYTSNLLILPAGTLMVPNSFTPNGDGVNDQFNVNITNLKHFTIAIFNRYGKQVFSSNNIFYSWDGKWNNEPVPAGAYFYRINGTDLSGKNVDYSGSITLIR